jgi:hypothetical protein
MNEDAVKAEMRLWALETLVCDMFVMLLSSHPNPTTFFSQMRAQMLAGARKRTFPGFDPSQSDLLSAELEAAVSRLLAMANEQMQIGLGNRAR